MLPYRLRFWNSYKFRFRSPQVLRGGRACFPTVYGFETRSLRFMQRFYLNRNVVHASLPFTVLKQNGSQCRSHYMPWYVVHASLPFTVLKRDEFDYQHCCLIISVVHASLPFTVLKHNHKITFVTGALKCQVVHASLPFTVLKHNHKITFVTGALKCQVVHASLPFTVLKLLNSSTAAFSISLVEGRACFPTVYGFETQPPQ